MLIIGGVAFAGELTAPVVTVKVIESANAMAIRILLRIGVPSSAPAFPKRYHHFVSHKAT
jgi:hypothetical protein